LVPSLIIILVSNCELLIRTADLYYDKVMLSAYWEIRGPKLFEIAWRGQTERQKKRRVALLGIKRHRLSLINQAAWYQA